MYGAWTQYPQHLPEDGQAIVLLSSNWDDIETALNGPTVQADVCVHRHGYVHDQHGGYRAMQPGAWWTPLPPANAKA